MFLIGVQAPEKNEERVKYVCVKDDHCATVSASSCCVSARKEGLPKETPIYSRAILTAECKGAIWIFLT